MCKVMNINMLDTDWTFVMERGLIVFLVAIKRGAKGLTNICKNKSLV